MIEELPTYSNILFGLTVIVTILWFYAATKSRTFLFLIIFRTMLQSILGLKGFCKDNEMIPPRIMLFGALPALVAISITFLTNKGRALIDNINLRTLTYLHAIRIPVEIVLALLFHQGLVSVYMT